jgi:flagellar hook-associated protein 1 FlgK
VVNDHLESFDSGGGQFLVRAQTAGTTLNLAGGSLAGRIQTRDGSLAAMSSSLETLATNLITEVNTIHASGYGLDDTTGNAFFIGIGAGDIAVNPVLKNNSRLVQAGGTAGADSNNTVALRLSQLGDTPVAALLNQTFGGFYGQAIAAMGEDLNSLNGQIGNQDLVQNMLENQRDSVMGVSIDEEMTDLMKFQKAFSASAKMITTVDEMLDTVINLKR